MKLNRSSRLDPSEWFHGSPKELSILNAGSSITSYIELAKAYSHKPQHLEVILTDNRENGESEVEIKHDGVHPGFLYRVYVNNCSNELTHPQDNSGPLCEEMVTTRNLEVDLIGKVNVSSIYKFYINSTNERRTIELGCSGHGTGNERRYWHEKTSSDHPFDHHS